MYYITEEAEKIDTPYEEYKPNIDVDDELLTELENLEESMFLNELYIQESLPMSDANKKKIDEIHEIAKKDPEKSIALLNTLMKEKDPEKLISMFPSIKSILRNLAFGTVVGVGTTLAFGGATAPLLPLFVGVAAITAVILDSNVNRKYVNQYIKIYEDEIKYLEKRKANAKTKEEKESINKLLTSYKKSVPKLKLYKQNADKHLGTLEESLNLLYETYNGEKMNPMTSISHNPFHSFNEKYVVVMGTKIQQDTVYFIKESDLNAVYNYYLESDETLGYDTAMEKIADHNNIDASDILVIDETSKTFQNEINSLKNRIVKSTDPRKKEELRERLNNKRKEESERRNRIRLAKIERERDN